MKKWFFTIMALFLLTTSMKAMSYDEARVEALFLTDKMAYELGLSETQYDAAYEINLDYFLSLNTANDIEGSAWSRRNLDLGYVLTASQFRLFTAALYFYRPVEWLSSRFRFRIYDYYTNRRLYYFGLPSIFHTYKGGHSWASNGGKSWYKGRKFKADKVMTPAPKVVSGRPSGTQNHSGGAPGNNKPGNQPNNNNKPGNQPNNNNKPSNQPNNNNKPNTQSWSKPSGTSSSSSQKPSNSNNTKPSTTNSKPSSTSSSSSSKPSSSSGTKSSTTNSKPSSTSSSSSSKPSSSSGTKSSTTNSKPSGSSSSSSSKSSSSSGTKSSTTNSRPSSTSSSSRSSSTSSKPSTSGSSKSSTSGSRPSGSSSSKGGSSGGGFGGKR